MLSRNQTLAPVLVLVLTILGGHPLLLATMVVGVVVAAGSRVTIGWVAMTLTLALALVLELGRGLALAGVRPGD